MVSSKRGSKTTGVVNISLTPNFSRTSMGVVAITPPTIIQLDDIINSAITTGNINTGLNTSLSRQLIDWLESIDITQIQWYQNYNTMLDNIKRIQRNFVDPFADQSYNYIHNALVEYERLENDRINDITGGVITDLLQEIASAAYLSRALNNQILLLTSQKAACNTTKEELLEKIKELEDALLVHSGQPAGALSEVDIKWSTGKFAGGIPILYIIGRYNIMIAWYNYFYFNSYNPTATIEPQKYLFIKQMVETYGTQYDPSLGMSPALYELKRLEQESFN
jgi:hypothetical protein